MKSNFTNNSLSILLGIFVVIALLLVMALAVAYWPNLFARGIEMATGHSVGVDALEEIRQWIIRLSGGSLLLGLLILGSERFSVGLSRIQN